jgi:hypothetical protein
VKTVAHWLGIDVSALLLALACTGASQAHGPGHEPVTEDWTIRATILEAVEGTWPCSHRLESSRAAQPCRYSRALVVESGEVGNVLLTGAKVWMTGGTGREGAEPQHAWSIAIFDSALALEQRTALLTVLGALYPMQDLALTVVTADEIEWPTASTHARMGAGRSGEIALEPADGGSDRHESTDRRYANAARVEKLEWLRGDRHGYRGGTVSFEAQPTFGFRITIDAASGRHDP